MRISDAYFTSYNGCFSFPASPTRRLCMEFNKKIIAAKPTPPGDNSEYQEETENDIDDDDDVYTEQNFTDVRKCFCTNAFDKI